MTDQELFLELVKMNRKDFPGMDLDDRAVKLYTEFCKVRLSQEPVVKMCPSVWTPYPTDTVIISQHDTVER